MFPASCLPSSYQHTESVWAAVAFFSHKVSAIFLQEKYLNIALPVNQIILYTRIFSPNFYGGLQTLPHDCAGEFRLDQTGHLTITFKLRAFDIPLNPVAGT